MGIRRKLPGMSLAITAWMGMASGMAAEPGTAPGAELLRELVEVLDTGDQAAYERFVRENYAPAALAEYDAENQAALLARVYTDTGGLTIERIADQSPEWVQAEARARITGIDYCLTLNRSEAEGHTFITDFSARDFYPAGPALETPEPEEVVRTIDALAGKYTERDLFSGVILFARGDEVIFKKAYGKASIAYDVPMTVDTRLNTASIGKIFTGVAIAQLVEAGELSFDDTVAKAWPDYPNRDVRGKVTIRQLLTHTSGLGPKDYYDDPRYPALSSRLRSVADYFRLAVDTPLGAEPGEYLYSNSGYIILGAIVERLSHQSFYDFVRDRIFEPAGMTCSLYAPGDVKNLGTASLLTNFHEQNDHSYVYRLGIPLETGLQGGSTGGPQGGAWVTAGDLFSFVKAFRGGKLVSPATRDEMTTAQGPSGAGAVGLAGEARPGLGVEVITRNGHTFLGHTGGDFGIASFVYWYPNADYTTIALSNRDPRAARVLLNVFRALLTRKTAGDAIPPPQACMPPA